MLQIKNENTYKTDEKGLLEEFIITINEYFNCTIAQSGGIAVISLNDGQRFKLTLEEL